MKRIDIVAYVAFNPSMNDGLRETLKKIYVNDNGASTTIEDKPEERCIRAWTVIPENKTVEEMVYRTHKTVNYNVAVIDRETGRVLENRMGMESVPMGPGVVPMEKKSTFKINTREK